MRAMTSFDPRDLLLRSFGAALGEMLGTTCVNGGILECAVTRFGPKYSSSFCCASAPNRISQASSKPADF